MVIVDESDYITMKDPVHFVEKTKNRHAKVVCLTATPDDGREVSLEHELMTLLGYRKVLTEDKDKEVVPIVDIYRKMECIGDIMSAIDEFRATRGVLVFATGELY